MTVRKKVAIIGSGISGLGAAHTLLASADVTLFEAGNHFGGHANTVDVTLQTPAGAISHGIDTGFLVFNERTYPLLIALFERLGVHTSSTDMSFSVQALDRGRRLEWGGANLNTVFAQRSNLLRPRFLNMLSEVLRLNRLCTMVAEAGTDEQLKQTLGDFLDEQGFGPALQEWYLLPMLGCIWSCPTEQMLRLPLATMIRFCHNHGLLQVNGRPKWWTVTGGSRHYVQKITDQIADKRLGTPVQRVRRDANGVTVVAAGQTEHFDRVIIATHAPQALALLSDPSDRERSVLGAFQTQSNRAVLHLDTQVLPHNRLTWSAWNYERSDEKSSGGRVCLHYLINKLQPIPFKQAVIVSLNTQHELAPGSVLAEFEYAHPVMDLAATQAQQALGTINGVNKTWFCGAWTRYGFHEDGLMSGVAAAQALMREHQANTP